VILNIGGVVETASWKELPDAVLLAWQPGQEGGNAIADVICGDVNPSGHLPMTFPASYADVPSQNFPIFKVTTEYVSNIRGWLPKPYEVPNVDYTEYSENVEVGYRYYTKHNVSVSYPFGYGLSYTTFQANKLKVKAVSGGYKFSFDVKNTGDCAGKTVLQLYSQDPGSVLTRELRGFAKTPLLEPGKSCKLSVFIPTEDLAYFDESRSAWITAAGTHQISLAFDANTDIETVDVTVEEEMVREVKPIVK